MEKVKSIKITVEYELEGGGSGLNDFRNLQELKDYLDKYPERAKALGYTKMKKP